MNVKQDARRRRIFLALGFLCLVVGGVAVSRLIAVVSATPTALLLVDTPQLVNTSIPVTARTKERADFFARIFTDAQLAPARLAACRSPSTGGSMNDTPGAAAECLAAIDGALDAAPFSGELWLYRAAILARSGDTGPDAMAALLNSYRVARREGWVASARVVLCLRLYPLLTEDLKKMVRGDLAMVLGDPRLDRPLLAAYSSDFALHQIAEQMLGPLATRALDGYVVIRARSQS